MPLRTPPKERVILLALALAVATLVLVLLVRRDDASGAEDSTVQAGAPSAVVPNAAPSAPENPAANAPPPNAMPANATPALMPNDAALHDTQNRYTVRLIQYPNDARGLALATEAYHWLVKYGFPAGSPIRLGSGRGIVLCASAKATTEELVPLRDQLQRLRYPESSKTMPFSTAFIDEIDHVLAR